MGKTRRYQDTISEQEYTLNMSASTDPWNDSPADSEMDRSAEFVLGMHYAPRLQVVLESGEDDLQDFPNEVRTRIPRMRRKLRSV